MRSCFIKKEDVFNTKAYCKPLIHINIKIKPEKEDVKGEDDGKPLPTPSKDQINQMLKKTQEMINARKK